MFLILPPPPDEQLCHAVLAEMEAGAFWNAFLKLAEGTIRADELSDYRLYLLGELLQLPWLMSAERHIVRRIVVGPYGAAYALKRERYDEPQKASLPDTPQMHLLELLIDMHLGQPFDWGVFFLELEQKLTVTDRVRAAVEVSRFGNDVNVALLARCADEIEELDAWAAVSLITMVINLQELALLEPQAKRLVEKHKAHFAMAELWREFPSVRDFLTCTSADRLHAASLAGLSEKLTSFAAQEQMKALRPMVAARLKKENAAKVTQVMNYCSSACFGPG